MVEYTGSIEIDKKSKVEEFVSIKQLKEKVPVEGDNYAR